MVLGKTTIDDSVRYVPKGEQTKEKEIKPKKSKSWFSSSQTEQKNFTKKKIL